MRRFLTAIGILVSMFAFGTLAFGTDVKTINKGKLVVGMECDFAPNNWTTVKKSPYAVPISKIEYADGYDVVIASRVAEILGLELEVKKIAWEGLIPALQANEIDVIIAGMAATPARAESVTFTGPYHKTEYVLVVRKDSPLVNATSIQDFKGKSVLGQINTLYDKVIDQIDGVIHATPQSSYSRMLLSIQENEVDAIVSGLAGAKGAVMANPDLTYVRFAEGKGFDTFGAASCAAVKLGNTQLQSAVQAALDQISDAEREEIMDGAIERQPAATESN